MGRRDRERGAAGAATTAGPPVVVEFPPGRPRIRVVIAAGRDPAAREVATRYWEITEDGRWARTAPGIVERRRMAEEAAAVSHALLLNARCAECAEPIRVTSRSSATKLGGTHLDGSNGSYLCGSCRAGARPDHYATSTAATAPDDTGRFGEADTDDRERETVRRIAAVLAAEGAKDGKAPRPSLTAPAALALYAALADAVWIVPGQLLPSLGDLGPAGWTGDPAHDGELLLDLHGAGLLALSPKTPRPAFHVPSDGSGLRLATSAARWRTTGGAAGAAANSRAVCAYFTTAAGQDAHDARQVLADLVVRAETAGVAGYLDGLLSRKLNSPPVTTTRGADLTAAVRRALTAGLTPGQLTCLAWRAADTAVTRTPYPAMSAVPLLEAGLDEALGSRLPLPEYDQPSWHRPPRALPYLRELNTAVLRVRDPAQIAACPWCDDHGLCDTTTDTVTRCVHPPGVPEQPAWDG